MKRSASVLFLLLAASALPAQDRVTYYERTAGKEVELPGTIQSENAQRVAVKAGMTSKDIPAQDVVDIFYEVPGGVRLDYGRLMAQEKKLDAIKEEERGKTLTEMVKEYQALAGKLATDKNRAIPRHLRFKAAQLQTRLADEDEAQRPAALQALQAFLKENPDSWQLIPASRLLGRLQQEQGDLAAALKTYQDLAAANLSPEGKREASLLVAQALIEAKKYPEARKQLELVQKSLTTNDPLAPRIQGMLAVCQAGSGELAKAVPFLENLIAKTSDKLLKAALYNALGDSYRLNGKPRDALWAYLHVDVLYSQDRLEHGIALRRVAALFQELGDETRAGQFRERLRKLAR